MIKLLFGELIFRKLANAIRYMHFRFMKPIAFVAIFLLLFSCQSPKTNTVRVGDNTHWTNISHKYIKEFDKAMVAKVDSTFKDFKNSTTDYKMSLFLDKHFAREVEWLQEQVTFDWKRSLLTRFPEALTDPMLSTLYGSSIQDAGKVFRKDILLVLKYRHQQYLEAGMFD